MVSYCFSVERTALPEVQLYQEYFCKSSSRNTSSSPSIASASGNVKLSLLHKQNSVHLSVLDARAAPVTWHTTWAATAVKASSICRLRRNCSEDALWVTCTGINVLLPQLEILDSSVSESPNLALCSPLAP